MYSIIAALRTKLSRNDDVQTSSVSAGHRHSHPVGVIALSAGLLVSAALGSVASAQGDPIPGGPFPIGPFSLAPISGTAELTQTSGTFTRPTVLGCNTVGALVHYATVEFTVDTTGSYTFGTVNNSASTTTSGPGYIGDPFLVVYQSPFIPETAAFNCLAVADDVDAKMMNLEAVIPLNLVPGTIYIAVITTFADGLTGFIDWEASGVGQMAYLASVTAASIPSPTAMGGTLTVQVNKPDSVVWTVLASGAAAPSPAQAAVGHGADDQPGIAFGSFTASAANTDFSGPITGLSENTSYDVYVVASNGGTGSNVRKLTLMTGLRVPVLDSSVPADEAIEVAPGSTITLTFDLPITSFGTGFIDIDNLTDLAADQQIDVTAPGTTLAQNGDQKVLTITPPIALLAGKNYQVRVGNMALVGTNGHFAGILGGALNFTTAGADLTPNAFGWPVQSGLPPSSFRTSAPITVSGLNVAAPISVTNGYYSINGGTATATPGSVSNDDQVRAFATTSPDAGAYVSATVNIGTLNALFTVQTGFNLPLITADNFYSDEFESNCAEGGVRVRLGVDYNDDGVLNDEEATRTVYICNGRTTVATSLNLNADPLVCPTGGVEVTFGFRQLEQADIDPTDIEPTRKGVTSILCNGLNALISMEPIESDVDCPNAGLRVLNWIDRDGNGVLSEEEDATSQKVCNGVDGLDGIDILIKTTTLTPDPLVCPRGGIRVMTGKDLDRDDVLDAEEVTSNEKICHGVYGLVETKVLAPKADECPAGGLQLDSGADTDGDGVLADGERDVSRKLCNAVSSVSRTTKLKPDEKECAYGGTKLESGLDVDSDHQLDSAEVTSSALICNGTNLAVRTIALEVGSEECPAGGSVIETGIDTNGDTELGDSEISKRQVLCQPPQLLFETTTINVDDDTCPHGGLRVTSGHDDGQPDGTAGDGILQAGENELDKSICLAPTNVLVSGGSGSCTVTPGPTGSTAMLWSTALGVAAVVVRRRRRTLGRKH